MTSFAPPTEEELFKWKRHLVKENQDFFNKLSPNYKEALRVYKHSGYQAINEFLRSENHTNKPFGVFNLEKNDWVMPHTALSDFNKSKQKLSAQTTLKELGDLVQKYHVDAYISVINDLDKVFSMPSVPRLISPTHESSNRNQGITLYRGANMPRPFIYKRVGDMITFNDYLSTSLSPEIPLFFMNLSDSVFGAIEPILFIIHNYERRPYVYLDWQAVKEGEMSRLKYAPGFDEYEVVLPRGCTFKILKKYKSTEYNKYTNPDRHKLFRVDKLYSDIARVGSDFLDRKSIKSLINKPVELTVMELEFVKQTKPKPIEKLSVFKPTVITGMELNLGDLPVDNKKNSRKSSLRRSKSNRSTSATLATLAKTIKKK